MGAKILTGYTGERHITPLDDAAVYRSIIGPESYITGEGERCDATMPTINEFDILSGLLSIQGVQVRISAETLTVDTCASGSKRKDIVAARWTHDTDTLIDDVQLEVIKGVEVSSGSPVLPSYNTGSIADGAVAVDMPLYIIDLDGSTVTFSRIAEIIEGNIGDGSIVVVSIPSFSTLPQTISDSRILSSHIAIDAVLSNEYAQRSAWTVTTSVGSLTVSGTISGSTTADIYLLVRR